MRVKKKFDTGELFLNQKNDRLINGYELSDNELQNAYIPKKKDNWFAPQIVGYLIEWFNDDNSEPLYIHGPTGCGKSEVIKQVCSLLNYPVYEITGHARLDVQDLIGHITIQDGNMNFQDGALTSAMKNGGLFLFNEIDLCMPDILAGLNTILDGSNLVITENKSELVIPQEGFRFVVTANSNGSGDDSGLYQGVTRQNMAFLDRFILLEMDYLPQGIELEILTKAANNSLDEETLNDMLMFANCVRKAHSSSHIESSGKSITSEVTMSTRTLLRWVKLNDQYTRSGKLKSSPLFVSLGHSLLNKASESNRLALKEIYDNIFLAKHKNIITPDEEVVG